MHAKIRIRIAVLLTVIAVFGVHDLQVVDAQCHKQQGCILMSSECRDCDGGPCGTKRVGELMQSFFWMGPAPGFHNFQQMGDENNLCYRLFDCYKVVGVQCPLTEEPGYWDCGTTLIDTHTTADDWMMWNPC